MDTIEFETPEFEGVLNTTLTTIFLTELILLINSLSIINSIFDSFFLIPSVGSIEPKIDDSIKADFL